jgi:tetratricopeptide (TPR) repeat protein
MAKKRFAVEAEHPIVRIGAELERANYPEAWKLARHLVNQAANADNLGIARNVLTLACEHYAEANRPADFAKFYALAESLPKSEGNEWTITLGLLQAKAGYFTKAKQLLEPLNDPAAMVQAIAHVADKAIVSRHGGLLPAEYQPAYEAILAAFHHYQTGNDEAARESLNAVGLQSPYLEWKVLLRGLIAFTASDDARAIENFARLNPDRIPSRLAAIFRTRIDTPFRNQQTPEVAANAERKYSGFAASVLHQNLKAIQQNLGRGKSLAPAFSAVETAIPFIKAQKPGLLPRLANCLYHAILQQGQPDDMKRYRKSFGPPKEDPQFNRLQGIVLEQTDQLDGAFECWKNYGDWLAIPPEGWPKELTKRVQARVLFRVGNIAADLTDWEEEPDDDDYFDIFGPPRKKKKSKAPREIPDAKQFLSRAMELAPDWEELAVQLFKDYEVAEQPEKAEAVARAHLKINPEAPVMLANLGNLLGKQGRAAECLECRKKALAANPLDKGAIGLALKATIAAARRHVAEKDYDAAEALLTSASELNGNQQHYSEQILRIAIAQKRGRPEEVERLLAAFPLLPQGVLVRQFLGQIHATVLKYKPADKKAAVAEFADALKHPQLPIAWVALYWELGTIEAEGWNFTGQPALRKKILTAIAGSAQPNDELNSEGLAAVLQNGNEWPTLQKLAASLAKIYPRNPLFLLMEVEAALAQLKKTSPNTLTRKLYKAEDLIRLTPGSRHAHLLPRIQQILNELNPMRSMFDSFFRPR